MVLKKAFQSVAVVCEDTMYKVDVTETGEQTLMEWLDRDKEEVDEAEALAYTE